MLALVVIVFVGDRIGDAVLKGVLLRSQLRFSRVYRGSEHAAIIVIGDSRAVNCFYAPHIEKRTGLPTLNLAYNALSSRIGEALLRDYLDRNAAPRLVIIEVTNAAAPNDLVSELRTYANLSPRLRALYAEQHPWAATAGRVFRLIAYDSETFLRAIYYLHRSDQDWIARSTMAPELLAISRKQSARFPIDTANLDSYERTLRLLRQRGIEVRPIIAPYEYPPRIVNAGEFIRIVEQRTTRVDPALHVRNYLTDGGPPENFADSVHMNLGGADSFMERLVRDGVFTP
jgi:hypothetical protein